MEGSENEQFDDQLDEDTPGSHDIALLEAENKTAGIDDFMIINTNARSLCPKAQSFIDCFTELDVNLATVTETWFGDSPDLQADPKVPAPWLGL